MLWKTIKSRKLHQESLSHIFKQIRLSFDFKLYPSLLVAAQTFTLHFFVVVRRRENYRLNWIIASTLSTVIIRNRHKTVLDPAKSNSWSKHYRSAPIETRRPEKVGYPWHFAGITPWKRGCKGCRRFRLLMILKRRIPKRELRVMPLSPLKDNADESVLFEGVEMFFGKSHFQRSVMCLCKTSQVIISRQKIERLKRRLPRASSWSYQS